MTIFSLRKMYIFHKQRLPENVLFWCYFFFKVLGHMLHEYYSFKET